MQEWHRKQRKMKEDERLSNNMSSLSKTPVSPPVSEESERILNETGGADASAPIESLSADANDKEISSLQDGRGNITDIQDDITPCDQSRMDVSRMDVSRMDVSRMDVSEVAIDENESFCEQNDTKNVSKENIEDSSGGNGAEIEGEDTENKEKNDQNRDVKEETRPRLIIMDQTGDGNVLFCRIDPKKEEVKMGGKRDMEFWRMISRIRDYSVAVLDNQLFLTGGFHIDDRKYLGNVFSFDPMTEEWTEHPSLAIPRSKHTSLVVGGKLMVIGGEKSDGKATASSEVYDPDTEEPGWNKSGMLLAPRKCHACAANDHVVYMSGGLFGKVGHRNIWVYERYQWHEMDSDYPTELSHGVDRHAMILLDNTLYFMGGINHKGDKGNPDEVKVEKTDNTIQSFKPTVYASNKENKVDLICPWDWELPNLPKPRHSCGTLVLGRKIYLIGGSIGVHGGTIQDVDCLDVDTRTWSQPFTLPKGNFSNVTCAVLEYPLVRKKKDASAWQPPASTSTPTPGVYDQVKKWVLW